MEMIVQIICHQAMVNLFVQDTLAVTLCQYSFQAELDTVASTHREWLQGSVRSAA